MSVTVNEPPDDAELNDDVSTVVLPSGSTSAPATSTPATCSSQPASKHPLLGPAREALLDLRRGPP
jgi:hypothetical protein